MMRVLFTMFLIATTYGALRGNTYYISAKAGSDSAAGTSPAAPWRSLARAGAHVGPGDSILLHAGEIFRETLTLRVSGTAERPITVGSYGDGAPPLISGADVVRGVQWTETGNGIYRTSLGVRPDFIYVQGEACTLARTPNQGYFSITSNGVTAAGFSDSARRAWDVDPVAGYALIRTSGWSVDTRVVRGFDRLTGAFELDTTVSWQGGTSRGFGYILSNRLAYLDQAGEYYYDSAAATLWIKPRGPGAPPDSLEITRRDFGVELTGTGHAFIVIEHLDFRRQGVAGIYLADSSSSITISNNAFAQIPYAVANRSRLDVDGQFRESTTTGLVIRDNMIRSMYKEGLHVTFTDGSMIAGNTVRDCGPMIDAAEWLNLYHGAFRGTAAGIGAVGRRCVITGNTVVNCGHYGIRAGSESVVAYNLIDSACLSYHDCGGIYRYYDHFGYYQGIGPVRIERNVIRNVLSNSLGTPFEGLDVTPGIYLDYPEWQALNQGMIDSVLVRDNTIVNAGVALGFTGFVPSRHTGNTFYNCRSGYFSIAINAVAVGKVTRRMSFTGNTVADFAGTPLISWVNLHDQFNQTLDYAACDSNHYLHPAYPLFIYRENLSGAMHYDLAAWQRAGYDASSSDRFSDFDRLFRITDTLPPGDMVRNPEFTDPDVSMWYAFSTNPGSPAGVKRDSTASGGGALHFESRNTIPGNSSTVGFGTQLYDTARGLPDVHIEKDSSYLLTFDTHGDSVSNFMNVGLFADGVSEPLLAGAAGAFDHPVTHRFVITAAKSAQRARLEFSRHEIKEPLTVWADNVSFFRVDHVRQRTEEAFPLLINAGMHDTLVELPAELVFVDLDSNEVTSPVHLEPFTSKVLVMVGRRPAGFDDGMRRSTSFARPSLTVFPNPVRAGEDLHVLAPELDGTDVEIKLLDLLGRTVECARGGVLDRSRRLSLPEHLAAGIYQVILRAGGRERHATIVVAG